MTRKKHWSKIVEEAGVRVRVYERPASSSLWYSVVRNGKKHRKSLKTSDRKLAEERARAIARELARAHLTGEDLRTITLGGVFTAYRQHRLPGLKPYRQRYTKTLIHMFTEAWGADLPVCDVDQSRVDTYVAKRRALEVLPPSFRLNEKGQLHRGGRRPTPPRDGTLNTDFGWLSSVFNWARRRKEGGHRLLRENPLHDVTWPREQNIRRPVARHERYLATLGHVDTVDPEGRLRCIVSLARFTGRRESAICHLRASDLLLSERRILEALAAGGMDEALAEHMPHGAIRWRSEEDKQGLLFITPVNRQARGALDIYLTQNPRMGDVPLFPAPGAIGREVPLQGSEKPISRHLAAKWLLRAEGLAKLPKLDRGTFHPYRRLWASERKGLPDVDVAHAAGWKDTRAMKVSYQQADPATVLRVVELEG